MKKISSIIFSVFMIALLSNCTSSKKDESDNKADLPDPNAANVVVLCDISASVSLQGTKDTLGLAKRMTAMLKSSAELIRHYPPGSVIEFYLIGSNAFQRPFLTLTQRKVYQLNQDEILAGFDQAENRLAKVVDSAATAAEQRTCILTSLEGAYRALQLLGAQTGLQKNDLVIYSDMVEECDDSPVGKIMMNSQAGGKLLTQKDSSTLAGYEGSSAMKSMQPNIRISMTTPYMTVQTARAIQDTWTRIFTRMGSAQAANGKLVFEPQASFATYKLYKKPA